MNKLLTSLIYTGTLLTASEQAVEDSSSSNIYKSNLTIKETKHLVDHQLKGNEKKKKIINIRGHKILNPGGSINNDIRQTIFNVAKVIDKYIPENISLKGKVTNKGTKPYGTTNTGGKTLAIYYNYKF